MKSHFVLNQQISTGSQSGTSGKPATQPGQKDPQAGQSSQFSPPGSVSPGTEKAAASRSREVTATGSPLARAPSAVTLLPPVDIFEDENGFTLIADMPGVSKDQLNVRVAGDSLVIEGQAAVPEIGSMELVYGEIQSPQYRRSFTLSRELDPTKIDARLQNGVLSVRIPKAEQAKPRRIEINVG